MSPSREIIKRGRKAAVATSGTAGLLAERELRAIIDNVLRLAKSTEADEAEVHVDEVDDSLTRFANNAIHQNVAERGLTVSIRTVVDGRTARATTNRIDEDSLRAAIESSLSLAHSQPKDPRLLAMPGRAEISPAQSLRRSNRRDHSRRSRPRRQTRLRSRDHQRPGSRRNLCQRHVAIRDGQFARPFRQLSRNPRRILHHDAGVARRKLGESKRRECPRLRSAKTCRHRQRQSASRTKCTGTRSRTNTP